VVRVLAATHLDHPKVVEARRVVGEHFATPDSLGILRLRVHQPFIGRMYLNRLRGGVVRDPSAARHVRPAIICRPEELLGDDAEIS
jgi:hypothetical protein